MIFCLIIFFSIVNWHCEEEIPASMGTEMMATCPIGSDAEWGPMDWHWQASTLNQCLSVRALFPTEWHLLWQCDHHLVEPSVDRRVPCQGCYQIVSDKWLGTCTYTHKPGNRTWKWLLLLVVVISLPLTALWLLPRTVLTVVFLSPLLMLVGLWFIDLLGLIGSLLNCLRCEMNRRWQYIRRPLRAIHSLHSPYFLSSFVSLLPIRLSLAIHHFNSIFFISHWKQNQESTSSQIRH